MSAFIVSDDHISLLVQAALDAPYFDASRLLNLPGAPTLTNADSGTTLGRALLAENTRSVMARYRGEDHGGKEATNGYTFRRIRPDLVTPIQVLKACDCFDYQACETRDYSERWAAKWIERLRGTMIPSLPGWDQAQWCFQAPEDMGEIIALSDMF
jgi:hypothetical protein